TIDRCISRGSIRGRSVYGCDLAPVLESRRGYLVPRFCIIASQMNVPVVGSDPYHVSIYRRWCNRVDDTVATSRCAFNRHVFLTIFCVGILSAQIWAYNLPAVALIERTKQNLHAALDRDLRQCSTCDRGDPLVPISHT